MRLHAVDASCAKDTLQCCASLVSPGSFRSLVEPYARGSIDLTISTLGRCN
jgi:hypothetical protein